MFSVVGFSWFSYSGKVNWVPVGPAALLPPGAVEEVIAGDRPIALCNVDGEIHALAGTCPHLGGPLGHGAVHDGLLHCPWHAWEFDCRTGRNPGSPHVAVPVFPVKVENGTIYVDISERA